MTMRNLAACFVFAMGVISVPLVAVAGEARIVGADAVSEPNGTWRFSVTVSHEDKGWDHYADLWQVEAPDGRILGKRVLAHPHENEQPFTRTLSGVNIPDNLGKVPVRAHDSVHGYGKAFIMRLPLAGK